MEENYNELKEKYEKLKEKYDKALIELEAVRLLVKCYQNVLNDTVGKVVKK